MPAPEYSAPHDKKKASSFEVEPARQTENDTVPVASLETSLLNARATLDVVDSAPWKRLLTKVERFNDIMSAISEVSLTNLEVETGGSHII